MQKEKIFKSLILIIFCLFTFWIIFLSSNLTFISDDWYLIKSALNDPFPITSDWTHSEWIPAGYMFFRPLIIYSIYINYKIFGYNAYGYYLTNILIHLLNAILIYFLMHELKLKRSSKLYLLLCTLIFFLMPYSLSNVLWISGRTDLIVLSFLLASLYLTIKYARTNKLIFLVLVNLFVLGGLMSKESFFVAIFYFLILFLYNEEFELNLKYLQKAFLEIFILLILYLFYRYLIFNITSTNFFLNLSLLKLFKFFSYGIWNTFIQVEILDYLGLLQINIFWAIFSFLIILFAFFTFFISYKNNYKLFNRKTIFACAIFIFSFLIYLPIGLPYSRFYYVHIPLILITIINLKYNRLKIHFIQIYSFLIIFIFGSITFYCRIDKINSFTKSYINVLPTKYEENSIVDLASLLTICHSWCIIPGNANIMADFKINNKFSLIENNKIISPFYYQTCSLGDPFFSLTYSITKDKDIEINVSNNYDVLIASEEIPEESKFGSQYFRLKNGIELFPKEYSKIRSGYLKSLVVRLPDFLKTNSTEIIYLENGEIKRDVISLFFEKFR